MPIFGPKFMSIELTPSAAELLFFLSFSLKLSPIYLDPDEVLTKARRKKEAIVSHSANRS